MHSVGLHSMCGENVTRGKPVKNNERLPRLGVKEGSVQKVTPKLRPNRQSGDSQAEVPGWHSWLIV